jgi:3-hydroxybutyryl-CoA dehydrogenase
MTLAADPSDDWPSAGRPTVCQWAASGSLPNLALAADPSYDYLCAHMTIAAITENHPEKDLSALFPGAEVRWMATIPAQAEPDIAAYVDLDFVADTRRIEKLGALLPNLVFVNAVTPTILEIGRPFIRINAWPGFATLRLHELVIPGIATEIAAGNPAGTASATAMADRVGALYQQLDCRYLAAPDVPGMISARVVAGIINEAWYTWEEKVSTKEEIDTAMRLGTNYPFGPFEWGERIGLGEVTRLLLALSKTDERYTPAGLLLEAAGLERKAG